MEELKATEEIPGFLSLSQLSAAFSQSVWRNSLTFAALSLSFFMA